MPVPARLSRRLQEALGDDAGNDMVDWMQRTEDHRTELRELNELTASRVEAQLGEMEARFGRRLAETDGRVEELRHDMQLGFARLETMIERRFADIMKWSFVFWAGSVVTLVGALAAVQHLFG